MELVIDANIIRGFFQESLHGSQSFLTSSTINLFDRIGKCDYVYLDEKGIIKNEWRNVVDPDWFDAWYPGLLIEGAAYEIPIAACSILRRKLLQMGFPATGKDIWYIRTAKSVRNIFGRAIIITEDMDFYNPSKKGTHSKNRVRVLISGKGPIVRYLERNESIIIRCIANYP